jgi:type IV secretion system protein TrbC
MINLYLKNWIKVKQRLIAQWRKRLWAIGGSLRWLARFCLQWITLCFMLFVSQVFASGGTKSDLPFVSTVTKLKDAISGPFLLSGAIIMVVATCLMLAFGEWGDGFKRMINVVLWLSVAFAAATFISTMFGTGSAL